MKIADAHLEMASSRVATESLQVRESLRMWVGERRPDFEANRRPPAVESAPVRISDAGQAAQQADAAEETSPASGDVRLQVLIGLIEALTGRKIRIFDASALRSPDEAASVDAPSGATSGRQGNGFGIEYDYQASYSESEQTTFAASGVVRTADGKTITFEINLAMQRSYQEETSVSLRLGDAVRKQDPLVINFAGSAAQLSDVRFRFDLDADGTAESIPLLAPGSGFLVFDRNGDGKANNGSELFGPASGNGFRELAALDQDGNGWIDENDSAYEQLHVWLKTAATGDDRLLTLKEANVGAIALAHVGTDFDLKGAGNQTLGQVRSTSVYLGDDGRAGTVQQIDLAV